VKHSREFVETSREGFVSSLKRKGVDRMGRSFPSGRWATPSSTLLLGMARRLHSERGPSSGSDCRDTHTRERASRCHWLIPTPRPSLITTASEMKETQ
jgi:hypothetical protein